MSSNIGQRIVDPRQLSDQLGAEQDLHAAMYSDLASYTFGAQRLSLSPHDAVSDTSESISPLSHPRLSPDRTPRPSVTSHSASSPLSLVSSHPSHSPGEGRPASSHHASSQSRRQSYMRDSYAVATSPPGSRSPAVSGSDSERSEDPSSSSDPITAAFFSPQRASLMSDNASLHTFGRGRASHTHGATAALSQDGAAPSSSSVSIASRSSSRASMRTTEQFSSDDELEIDDYYDDDGHSSPVTFARYDLADIDEDADLVDPHAPSIRSFVPDGRRGSLPMAIPGTVPVGDAFSIRSREGSILTVRRPSRSWDDASTYRSSQSGEDPGVILPKSEPNSRADWLSLEAQAQVKQQQQQHQQQQQQQQQEQELQQQPTVLESFDLGYILSKRSDGSVRSGHSGSGLSFVQQHPGGYRISSPYYFRAPGSTITLPIEDSFMRHIERADESFPAQHRLWTFQRERADASSSSSRRRQQAHHHRNDRSGRETGPRVQEMWRCGHVGRFKVDKIVFKPQTTDAAKGTQQRIHVRHIPDPFLGNTTAGPHSVIHKHSRAIAFSIFRSHSLFSGRQPGGAGPSGAQTHMNMRSGIMLAPKKVQEQYTSTKTMRQLNTHGLLESESRGSRKGAQGLTIRERDKDRKRGREKEDRSKGKTLAKSKNKGKSEKKPRANAAESTESSSAGSVTNHAPQTLISAGEQPMLKIQFSPSISSSMSSTQRESISRPSSPSSMLPLSIIESVHLPDSETSSIPPMRHYHRDSLDDDALPHRITTTHAEAFGALDPNDIENLRAKTNNRVIAEPSSTFTERFFRILRGSRTDDQSSGTQPRAFQPPWLITAGRDHQEENDRVLNDLNASFRDVGLLHTNPHKALKMPSKRKSSQGILDQVPDDSLYMLLPLWPGETDSASVQAETSSAASIVSTIPDNRQYLLVYYVPFSEAKEKGKKPEKKKAKQSHSSDSGIEINNKSVYLPEFRAVARVVTYDELRLSGVRVPSDGLAISGPEWEAVNYAASTPPRDSQASIVVCQSLGKDSGFLFLEDGLLQLGLCFPEDTSSQVDMYGENEGQEQQVKMQPTAIGKAAMEMIWLGCLALTGFGPT